MRLFLLLFLLIYSAMHLYLILRVRSAFSFTKKTWIYIILFVVIMISSPFIVWASERAGLGFFARIMAYTGYIWMGVLLLFTSISLVTDTYRLSLFLLKPILSRHLSFINPSARFSLLMPVILSMGISTYGYFEAKDIHTEKITIMTPKLPPEVGRLRVVQLSDVHIGLIIREGRLKRVLEKVETAEPDILISTGDLVDGQINDLEGLVELLQRVNPRYGKYAITGNHEFYAGIHQAIAFMERAGFTILRGEGLTVAGLINIVGVDDPAGKRYGSFKETPEKDLLLGVPHEKFTILLKHRPVLDINALGLFDLQLSGHAHKGQIFPFSLLTRLYYRHTAHAGHLRIVDDSYLYVSRGAGTWGPPIRFLSPPEVTVIDIVSATTNHHS